MSDLEKRLTEQLEPLLSMRDPRERISAYHDMPYALFRYDPEDEVLLRNQVTLLTTRLEDHHAKRVHRISLAECLHEAILSERPIEEWIEAEKEQGIAKVIETIHEVLAESDTSSLVELVAKRMPKAADPLTDIVFITRTGALFPMYRTFALLEQLKGRVIAPTVLFYPGSLDGPAGLRFMGVLEAEHNYRPKIF